MKFTLLINQLTSFHMDPIKGLLLYVKKKNLMSQVLCNLTIMSNLQPVFFFFIFLFPVVCLQVSDETDVSKCPQRDRPSTALLFVSDTWFRAAAVVVSQIVTLSF